MKLNRQLKLSILGCFVILLMKQPYVQAQMLATPATMDSLKANAVFDWVKGLYEPGVKEIGDSIELSAEANRLLTDENYRVRVYPKTYTWEPALQFIQSQDIKIAFWYMINLYMINEKYRELAIKSFLTYDRLFKMNQVLVNTFYTYVLADPEIIHIKNGVSTVYAPHVMEAKLNALKEILGYIEKYSSKENATTNLE